MAALNVGALKKMLPKRYKHRGLIVQELFNVMSHYKCLMPVVENYVFNDGNTQHLMNLTGTVPVHFIGKQFNIPVCLWLLDSYPRIPPICFVKPSNEMMVVTGQYTDANGQIDLPYLQEWSYPQSDLLGLIQVLAVVFGEEPPVCIRPPPNSIPVPVWENWEAPESWRKTEVISSSDKETYFTLKGEDGLLIRSENESDC
ncbi:hypothetical protein ANANG_G00200660 [Anguilla anguilla]|uniref:UEV domain-containing protein n=1 Tax=Anguilla anguilla TaxID=7936 RepID=A0A9D3RR08_ANGAN|nr:hypothetical protein ANANG_G00200660 [Anguilla anguilla]